MDPLSPSRRSSITERNDAACKLAARDLSYWLGKLDVLITESGGEAFHGFPTDYRRPASPGEKFVAPVVEQLDAVAAAALARLAQSQQVELHAVLLALLAAEARRRDTRSSLIIGSGLPVRSTDTDADAGSSVDLLPLILTGSSAQSLVAQIRATQSALIEAAEHSGCPSGRLYQEFQRRYPHARPQSCNALFDISLAGKPSGVSDAGVGSGQTPGPLRDGVDLAFSYEPLDDGIGLELSLVWNPDVYRRATAEAWLKSFAAWARWLAEDIGRADSPLPALLPEEARCLAEWEQGVVRLRPAKRFHELFESLADSQPHRPAVVAETGVQSYAELEQRANRVARVLLDHGVAREEPVAVLTECSPDLPGTVLGIWKAGATYLPLALEQPAERLAYLARDAGARTLIVLDGHVVPPSLAAAVRTILRPEYWQQGAPAARPEIAGTPQDVAVIIYTSGTSGLPKGVLLRHDGVINAGCVTGEIFGLTPEDRFSMVATPGFDASLWELGGALLNGMALVPVSQTLRDDPWALKRWYKTHGVTAAFHTPSYLRVSQQVPFEGMRVLIVGGEAPSHEDVRHHAGQGLAFWNGYGPTETSIFVCAELISAHPDADRPLSVGRPIANTCVSIRRDNGDRVPPGVVGEVWLGGIGLARGYLNNPELTDRRYIETPEGRFYRSGDLGRWTEDGRLELAGRSDDQIKLHGQRIELGEIEQALRSHPAVEEAVVLVDAAAEGTKVLRAFVRLRPEAAMPAEDEWRSYVGGRLPVHMVPASVTSVAVFPLTFSGKIDREVLLRSPRTRRGDAAKNPPRGEMEIRIAAVWQELVQNTHAAEAPSAGGISREDNFFALGGNSLLAVTMAHRLSRELNRPVAARDLFAAPTLAGFARRIDAMASDAPAPVSLSSDRATEGQVEFRVAEAAGLDTRTFTIPVLRLVEGGMPSLDRWNKAWSSLVARHEALRTYFYEDAEGSPRRAVVPAEDSALEVTTVADMASARAFVRQCQLEPFFMDVPPLWRAGLVEVADSGEHLFWMALHHSVGDGQSIGILVGELGALLRGEQLPELASGFGESAHREAEYFAEAACAADARYWRDVLAQLPDEAFAEGPLDFARSLTTQTGNHRFEMRLDPAIVQGLRMLARGHEASLHAVMLTLLALETRRRMGRESLILGATVSTRETASEANVVGYYVNMLPIACRVPRDITFGSALRETQRSLAAGLQHARYPFARIYRDFWTERPEHRHPARYPLFDLAVTESPAFHLSPALPRLAPLSAPAYELTDASPGQDMVLTHEALADGSLSLQWHVNAALYTAETAKSWLEALSGWAEWLASDRQRARQTLPSLLPHEATLLESWEQGPKVSRPALRFHELFERVLDTPDQSTPTNRSSLGTPQSERPAVITKAGITTYGMLEREANAIAHSLLSRGVVAGSVVGVVTGRSANLPAAMLGIWKAGATYLPLAADLPLDRLAFMARDAGMTHLIALDGLAVSPALPPALRPEELDAEFRRTHGHRLPPTVGADAAAYIIYTSGSTGRPKGTLVGHDAYVNTVLGAAETYGMTRDDRSLMFASPSFDVSLSDIGLPLATGAALCPVPYDVLSSPNRFRAFLTEFGVTLADVTPTYLRLFAGAALPSLRILVTGGEAPFPVDVEAYADRLQYFNAYGPTENAITSTLGRLRPGSRGVLSAGRPLPNTSVHVCDAEGNPVPPGVAGELWLGGTGLARGYVGRPELTAAAFVNTPQSRRYRSGDLGRWSANGEIEILGRIDDQVKLNGIRVELGEIEHALTSHPDVAQAVALLDREAAGNHRLWAFVRPAQAGKTPTEEEWREYLADRLPGYMIPSAVIAVDDIPLSNSGKVDKTVLKRRLNGRAANGEADEPRGGLETEIARLWADLLGHNSIRRDDNFFSLGGHSLLAIAVAHRLEETLGYPVPARELFAEPTLRGFAERVSGLNQGLPREAVSSDRATEAQQEFWVAGQASFDTRGFTIRLTLHHLGATEAQWQAAWTALVTRHDGLRTGFHQDRDGVLRRSVFPDVDTHLPLATLPDMSSTLAFIRERQAVSFAMELPPLWRAGLVQVAATDQRIFWLALHHSVADGVSLGVLAEEFATLFDGGTLSPVAGQFDHSAGQEELYLASPACQEDALYWRKTLQELGAASDETPSPFDEWPLDSPRAMGRAAHNAKGAHFFRVRLDAATAAGLRNFAQKNGASLHALMLTIMAQEVRRRTGRPAFLLGTAASTRDSALEARIVGCYVNMLPLACRVQRSDSVEQALRTMQRNLAEGLQHARYPFKRIYTDFRQDSGATPHPARHPLFDLSVTENPGMTAANFSDIGLAHPSEPESVRDAAFETGYELRPQGATQDMVLVHEAQADGSLLLHWHVNAAIYEKETAEAWLNSLAGWARFLGGGERSPDSPLPSLLPEEEKLLAAWENGPTLPHAAPSFPALFTQWVRRQPDRPAVVTELGTQSYAELDTRSNALAHALRAQGVSRQEIVGVLTGRSVSLPETVLAIWKAGAVYLPLVNDLPADRLSFIARDAGIRLLIVLDGVEIPASLAGFPVFRPESLPDPFVSNHRGPVESGEDDLQGSELAYIIYTSGSTGEPKGVMLRHQGLNNLAVSIAVALDMRSDDRASIMASPAFDAWIAELVMAWSVGGAVVPVLRDEMDDIPGLRAKFVRLGVTATTMPPSYLRLFGQADFPSLRLLLTAGEAPHRADALHYAPRLRYMNGYGPTENTVAVSFGRVRPQAQRLAAGKPLANTSAHIRNSEGEPLPPGATGLVWLGGMQLAAGYLNRPDLTAASFVETPTGRLYCTGDLGRWTPTGELEILGRSDGQVKLRGQRVELGEIEHRIGLHPGVRQAVAVVETTSGGVQTLWAFTCFHEGATEPTQAAWQDYLSATMPSYMLPSAVIRVPAIPVTTAGKVDKASLLRTASERSSLAGKRRSAPPREGLEQRIAEVWAEHLQCAGIGREDDFFNLGGNSLRAIAVVNHLRRTLQCTVNDLYEHPRLADFAGVCRRRPERLRTLIQSARRHWDSYQQGLAAYDAKREAALAVAHRSYATRNQPYLQFHAGKCRDYERVLLTGATGYLGSYLLRELLADRQRQVAVLVRGSDDLVARSRLGEVLCHYFGPEQGATLRDNPRLTVLAGDLRRDDLGLASRSRERLANSVQAVFHSAANVKHFGHYWEFHADNVAATGRLLKLAASRRTNPADFHFVSTLSTGGRPAEDGFRLFTEYDAVPDALEENYYVRSKQQAERLVVAARGDLANTCIYRVGNLVFPAEGEALQANIRENAFFRLVAAFFRLGLVPDDAHLWLCHVDVVARGLALLAGAADLTNETHHLEHVRRDTLASFVTAEEGVRSCAFETFLKRLEAAVDEPEMEAALNEVLEAFGLLRGVSPQSRARRLEIVSERTQILLARLGLVWPTVPAAGQAEMLRQAAQHFSRPASAKTRHAAAGAPGLIGESGVVPGQITGDIQYPGLQQS